MNLQHTEYLFTAIRYVLEEKKLLLLPIRSQDETIKQKDAAEEAAALQKHTSESGSASAGTTNLGALLKAKLGGSKDKE